MVKADLISRLDRNTPYEFDVDVNADENDQLVLANRDPSIFTTIADVDGVTLRINPVGTPRAGDSFDILDADQIQGTPLVISVDPAQLWRFDPRTGRVTFVGAGTPALQPGDADQDLDFDQLDLVLALVANKYLTAEPATWGQGDWNGAPGGSQGSPPPGDGRFNQLDIIAALAADKYLTGPYAAMAGDFTAVRPLAGGGDLGNVDVVYIPVPEPSTLVLLALAIVGAISTRLPCSLSRNAALFCPSSRHHRAAAAASAISTG